MRDHNKHTAVITDQFRNYHQWCHERRIRRSPNHIYTDVYGEQYTPILTKGDTMGRQFTDIELCEDYRTDKTYELYELTKQRIRKHE